MTHPSSLDLEAFACGEPARTSKVADHVRDCSACAAFVAQLQDLVGAGPSAAEVEALVARAVAIGAAATAPAPMPTAALSPPANVTSITAADPRRTKRRLWVIATSVVTPLAAAAAVLLMARSAPLPGAGPAAHGTAPHAASTGDTVQMGTLPPRTAPEPDTRFKGGPQVAVVRERGKDQARFSSTVRVRPGDRIRLEVALDREQAILGGVLADDGSYLELLTRGVRGPGTHFSERSAKIDALPTRGTILVGTPEAIARARETKVLEGVSTLRVEWELGGSGAEEQP